jgi:dUTP pyrophosphatase
MEVKIHRINKDLPLPKQANDGDAGFDVFASCNELFGYDEIKLVPLGIIAQAPKGFHFKLCLRSSMAYKRGFSLANGVGIIDHQFCGPEDEIKIMLKSPSLQWLEQKGYVSIEKGEQFDIFTKQKGFREIMLIKKGDRVGQLILEKNNKIEWKEQEDKNFAGESRGGFGSSGK